MTAACRSLSPLAEDANRTLAERDALDRAWMQLRAARRELQAVVAGDASARTLHLTRSDHP